MAKTVLKANNISIVFGGLKAVDNFSIEIKEGELVGLIGPNGAGKTTVFNMLTGVYIPTSGTIELCEKEIEYFQLLQVQLDYANFEDAKEIRSELEKNGYLRAQKNIRKSKKNEIPHFITLEYKDSRIFIGKNNIQNDYLTFHHARKADTWFHALDYHGAHIILQSEELNEDNIRTCAMLASYYSQGKNSSSVPVAYTQIKNLKKAKGKAIGQALMNSYKTIYIDPDEKTVVNLLDTYKK